MALHVWSLAATSLQVPGYALVYVQQWRSDDIQMMESFLEQFYVFFWHFSVDCPLNVSC